MIKRDLEKIILKSLHSFPIVGILGSRQVGKTTLAKEIQKKFNDSIYLDLELPSDFNKLIDPELYLGSHMNNLVIIDEIQYKPELFNILRSLVDKNRKPARYLILGSSSPDIIKKSSESLAGRIIYHELTPLLLSEIEKKDIPYEKLWLRGGYPDSLLARSNDNSFQWREAFIKTFLERDIPSMGIRIPAIQMRRFWTMLAHIHGNLWNGSKLSASLGVSQPMSKYYIDILSDTFIVNQLQPFFTNIKKRIIKSPKVYIRDTGLLHTLLGLKKNEELRSHPVIGYSWEGFVIEQICNSLPESSGKYFYRTASGAEADLVITSGDKPVTCIEIKYSSSPHITSGFGNAMSDLNCTNGLVVYPGNEVFPISKNILAVPFNKIFKHLYF